MFYHVENVEHFLSFILHRIIYSVNVIFYLTDAISITDINFIITYDVTD